MAFKLTKSEQAARAKFVEELGKAREEVQSAIAEANDKLEQIYAPVQEAVDKYNETLLAAKEWAQEIVGARQEDYDNKSERWQEGDNGSAAQDWINEWEGFQPDEIELEELPTPMDEPELDHAEDLEALPDAAG